MGFCRFGNSQDVMPHVQPLRDRGAEEAPIGWEGANRERAARPNPDEETGASQPYPLPGPGAAIGVGVLSGPGLGYRRRPWEVEGEAASGSPPLRVPGTEASNARSMSPGIGCPQRHNKKAAAFAHVVRFREHGSESRAGNF